MTLKWIISSIAVAAVGGYFVPRAFDLPAARDTAATDARSDRTPVRSTVHQQQIGTDVLIVDSSIDPQVATKYRYLLQDDRLDDSLLPRIRLLLQRREASVARETSAVDLSRVDSEITSLIGPSLAESYRTLRDSDAEQTELTNFAEGLEDAAPLNEAQRRHLLLSRLHHKAQYQTWVEQSGITRESLSPAEREYAHDTLASALDGYRIGYLQAVRPELTDEQFTRLSDFEQTEFSIELERLQQTINAR